MHHRRARALKKSSIKEQPVATPEAAAPGMPDKGIQCVWLHLGPNDFKVSDRLSNNLFPEIFPFACI